MTYTFRPALRLNTPMIPGLAGPSKSGKTYSALRLATGMAQGGQIAMINTEGPRGHQYADRFKYIACDLTEPFTMKSYEEAIKAASALNPAVLVIDSVSHAHEGIGGMLDQHEKELDRLAGNDYQKRQKMTWAAWVKPKADEASMINTMLQVGCHIILCFRAKEKIKIVKGKDPVDLGWQPIGSDRIHFETAFTLILPPHSKGTPDMDASEMRDPFDKMVKREQINEDLGQRLAEWATGIGSNGGKRQDAPQATISAEAISGHGTEDRPEGVPSEKEELQLLNWRQQADKHGMNMKSLTEWFDIERKKKLTTDEMAQLVEIFNQRAKFLKVGRAA